MRALVPELVVEALERGATIVTANERAARAARRSWDELQRSRGVGAWETARALSWRSWLGSLWHAVQVAGVSDLMLLSAAQEHRIWRAMVRPDEEELGERQLNALAAMCADAYGRVCEFRGVEQLQRMRVKLRGDQAAFADWARVFEQHCRRERLLTGHMLPGALAELLRREVVPRAEREIVLLGFDELLPAQEELLEAWRSRIGGASLLAKAAAGMSTLVCAPDQRAELRGFARWAAARLAAEPEARVALVVADMAGEREEVESVLREVLAPGLADIESEASEAPFEFSLGRPLATEPLVLGAMDMLAWLGGSLPLERVERLLLGNAFAGFREERAARGRFTSKLYRGIRLRPEATLEQTLRLLEQEPGNELPALRRGLRGLARAAATQDEEERSFGAWADLIRSWLEDASWAQGLSSRSYQVVERWQGVLDTLASLDFAGAALRWSEALASLRYLSEETIFAPERREAAVQVLGAREAAGSRFDALWVLRSGEMHWPPEQGGHTLLPQALERALGMPGGDREAARRGAMLLTERLAASAGEVYFSYAERTTEGMEERPASEVLALDPRRVSLEEMAPVEEAPVLIELERLADAGRIAPLRDTAIGGGTRVLELQAQCGFLAFSELRLQAKEMAAESFGLSAGERGNAVHLALETLWERLRSQRALLELPEAERWAVLETAVTVGLQRLSKEVEGGWERSYLEVQHERMRRLLRAWLKQEMERPSFVVSRQEEKQHALQVGPLQLSVRVDRIDVVNGARVLLDYKTGAADVKQWKGERPDRPQVPLYAVLASATTADAETADEPLGAVAFGRVVAGKDMGLQGFEREGASLLPQPGGRKMEQPSFEEQVKQWSEIVARLATEFAEGDARVRPKQFPGSCAHCGYRILCRVDAAEFDSELMEDDEEGAEDDG